VGGAADVVIGSRKGLLELLLQLLLLLHELLRVVGLLLELHRSPLVIRALLVHPARVHGHHGRRVGHIAVIERGRGVRTAAGGIHAPAGTEEKHPEEHPEESDLLHAPEQCILRAIARARNAWRIAECVRRDS